MTNKMIYFLLFMNLLFQVLLTSGEVEYSENSISDMKASLFNTKDEKIYYVGNLIKKPIIGFSDLNDDKYTDIISYQEDKSSDLEYKYTFYSNIFDKDLKKFKPEEYLFNITVKKNNLVTDLENISVRNLQIFYYNSKFCALVSFNNGNDKLLHFISVDKLDVDENLKDVYSNILIMNKDEDKKIRLLFSEGSEIKICTLKEKNYDPNILYCTFSYFKTNVTNSEELNFYKGSLSLKGGLGYVDLSGNCIPDIVLSFENGKNRTIEVFVSNVNYTYTMNSRIILDLEQDDEYGALAIANINDGKSGSKLPLLSILVPKIKTGQIIYFKNQGNIGYEWSNYYCENKLKDSQTDILFNSINSIIYNLTIHGEEFPCPFDASYPTVIRVGDFLAKSHPGIIVKQKKKEGYQISLYQRKDKEFKYYTGIDINKIDGVNKSVAMGLFFDMNEAGSLSFILQTDDGNNYFFFNFRTNSYFIKSKLMNDKSKLSDSNFGALYRYIVTDKSGDRHMDVGFQMAQTSDMNIPVPYGFMGLDDTNNYVEYFQTISGNILQIKEFASDDKNFKDYTPIIPNTQMMIYKFYNSKKKIEWNIDLIVQPMEQIWLFLGIVIIVLAIVLGVIIYLHLKEVKEEQKETNKFKAWFA